MSKNSTHKNSEKWIGFYTPQPFWVGNSPDISFVDKKNFVTHAERFKNILSEDVFVFKNKSFQLNICKDGLIIFRRKDLLKNIPVTGDDTIFSKLFVYLDYLNTAFLLLESSYLEHSFKKDNSFQYYFMISELTNENIVTIDYDNGKKSLPSISSNIVIDNYTNYLCKGRWLYNYEDKFIENLGSEDRFRRRKNIKKEVFEILNDNLRKVFDNYEIIKILSIAHKALAEYKLTNFSTSLILSWFIIEKYINKKWKDFIKIKLKGSEIIKNRMDQLKDDRTYTAAVKTNIMEFNDFLDTGIYAKINRVRGARNDIAHGEEVNQEELDDKCCSALEVVNYFLRSDIGIELFFNYSLVISGI